MAHLLGRASSPNEKSLGGNFQRELRSLEREENQFRQSRNSPEHEGAAVGGGEPRGEFGRWGQRQALIRSDSRQPHQPEYADRDFPVPKLQPVQQPPIPVQPPPPRLIRQHSDTDTVRTDNTIPAQPTKENVHHMIGSPPQQARSARDGFTRRPSRSREGSRRGSMSQRSAEGLFDVTFQGTDATERGQRTFTRHVSFRCASAPQRAHQKADEVPMISLAVRCKGTRELQELVMEKIQSGEGGNVFQSFIEAEVNIYNGDPSMLFEKPTELWTRMQEELKRVYCLSSTKHAIFTFKVSTDVGLRKEDGSRRVVIVNNLQFLHLLKKARWKDEGFFNESHGRSDTLMFKYEIALPHSVYLPPSFKNCDIATCLRYPPPTADQVRNFCYATGGMKQGPNGVSESFLDSDVAFGNINFRLEEERRTAKYALVKDIRRVHRFQTPGTNPHLLRFLLEDVWQLYQPGLIIEIAGSAQGLNLEKSQWVVLIKAIMGAAKSMGGWVITGGTDAGVMKLIGEGRAKYAPEIPLVGFASWKAIHQKEVLLYSGERKQLDKKDEKITYRNIHYNRHSKPSDLMTNLNPDHSHFILVDDSRHEKESLYGQEINLRADLMAVMTEVHHSPTLPRRQA